MQAARRTRTWLPVLLSSLVLPWCSADEPLLAAEAPREASPPQAEADTPRTPPSPMGAGHLRLSLPESAAQGLSGFRIVRRISEKTVKEGSLPSAVSSHSLLPGSYSLILLFPNPGHHPPSEMVAGGFTVSQEETTDVKLGALVFRLADEAKQTPAEAMTILESHTGREVLWLPSHFGGIELFAPKALPPGAYDVALTYRQQAEPARLASGLEVAEGKETVLALDSVFSLVRPGKTRIEGWSLRPTNGSPSVLEIRRGVDNEEPLWRPFPVPPGIYDLQVWRNGMDEAQPAGGRIVIEPGQSVRFDSGLP